MFGVQRRVMDGICLVEVVLRRGYTDYRPGRCERSLSSEHVRAVYCTRGQLIHTPL